MSKTQIVFIIATVILFLIGAWPIAILTLVGIVAIAIFKREEKKKAEKAEIEKLKQRIEELEKDR